MKPTVILFYVNWQSFSSLADPVTLKWLTLWIVLLCGKGRKGEEEKHKTGAQGQSGIHKRFLDRSQVEDHFCDKTIAVLK